MISMTWSAGLECTLAMAALFGLTVQLVRNFQRRGLLRLIEEVHVRFQDSVRRASAVAPGLDPTAAVLVRKLLGPDGASGEFADLARAAARGPMRLHAHRHRVQALGRLCAYILPPAELIPEGRAALADLQSWHLPEAVRRYVDALSEELERGVKGNAMPRARAALGQLLAARDHWGWVVRWYLLQVGLASVLLLPLLLLGMVGGVLAVGRGYLFAAFLLAGASGAAASILLKLPSLNAYGEATWFWIRTAGRFAGGITASAILFGLLAAGIVSLPLSPGGATLPQLIERCGSNGAGTRSANARGEPPPLGEHVPPEPCALSGGLFLLCLGMLCGFSERSLASFEQTFFAITRPPDPRSGPSRTGEG